MFSCGRRQPRPCCSPPPAACQRQAVDGSSFSSSFQPTSAPPVYPMAAPLDFDFTLTQPPSPQPDAAAEAAQRGQLVQEPSNRSSMQQSSNRSSMQQPASPSSHCAFDRSASMMSREQDLSPLTGMRISRINSKVGGEEPCRSRAPSSLAAGQAALPYLRPETPHFLADAHDSNRPGKRLPQASDAATAAYSSRATSRNASIASAAATMASSAESVERNSLSLSAAALQRLSRRSFGSKRTSSAASSSQYQFDLRHHTSLVSKPELVTSSTQTSEQVGTQTDPQPDARRLTALSTVSARTATSTSSNRHSSRSRHDSSIKTPHPTPAVAPVAAPQAATPPEPQIAAPPQPMAPMAPQPMAPQPMAPQPMAPQPMAPQPMAPQPMAPQPMAPMPAPTALALNMARQVANRPTGPETLTFVNLPLADGSSMITPTRIPHPTRNNNMAAAMGNSYQQQRPRPLISQQMPQRYPHQVTQQMQQTYPHQVTQQVRHTYPQQVTQHVHVPQQPCICGPNGQSSSSSEIVHHHYVTIPAETSNPYNAGPFNMYNSSDANNVVQAGGGDISSGQAIVGDHISLTMPATTPTQVVPVVTPAGSGGYLQV